MAEADPSALDILREAALAEIAASPDLAGLDQVRVRYLGKSGLLTAQLKQLGALPKEDRPAAGARINLAKEAVQAAIDARRSVLDQAALMARLAGERIDVTLPGRGQRSGGLHPVTRTLRRIEQLFANAGFAVAEGPEVEDEFHNFIALNIPPGHPARDPADNFYMGGTEEGSKLLLRSQTSTVQIRAMEKTAPPLKVVAVGRVYRPDTHDATHYSMFHQIEGLYVDRNVTMVDLKTTLFQFARAYFGPEAEVRMRPSFFPFTEPSAEVDMKMRIKGQWQWVELGGCGLVDPNVFRAVGYDPEEWSGFAFGLGIERIAMRRYGISDIRWLFENDARFLRQFG